ncbi:hypothetical protein AKJ39_02430 [candidate division MSBL1 archaeon SCGC-AAA259J03]|uniref:DNA primase DnaG n=1 Tax=candidate division MSBL1 archaeon SCGC-AAA259J03 TaxID=1698269 RepID=A0A656YWC1_9EURY|nr:hypothetical protein AKJ39_02430 [candidate division MSBL1 archaeon SCGC-AAA259J03]
MGRKKRKARYVIRASIAVDGAIRGADIVDALFNKTGVILEGLDLSGLRRKGKIGRVKANVGVEGGDSKVPISIPSRLGEKKTAMIAAAMETVEQVGPLKAKVEIDRIQDAEEAKREYMKRRARELVEEMEKKRKTPGPERTAVEGEGLERFKGVPAGPKASESDAVIIVQNRSGVINLLSHGIKNVVAIEVSEFAPAITEICEGRTSTAFLDGDRSGDLILKELLEVVDLDHVARAHEGKKVEDLSGKDARKALKNKVAPCECSFSRDYELGELAQIMRELEGSLKACILGDRLDKAEETKVRDLLKELSDSRGVRAVLLDGVITQRLADLAAGKGLKYLIGARKRLTRKPEGIEILTREDLKDR